MEAVAQLYADKHGLRAFGMRIGYCGPEPLDARMLKGLFAWRVVSNRVGESVASRSAKADAGHTPRHPSHRSPPCHW